MGCILRPRDENGSTVYSGVIQGEQAVFTVTADKTVTFTYGDKIYGPFTAKEDPTAVPDDKEFMTGVEIRQGKDIFFCGGVFRSGEDWMLFNEDGGLSGFAFSAVMSDGTVVDSNGNMVDRMAPSASAILQLMDGPALTSKGEWMAWFCGAFLSIATAASILFADEIFRWNLTFQIRDAERAEPSEWEMAGRYISWTVLPVIAFVFYIMGLK